MTAPAPRMLVSLPNVARLAGARYVSTWTAALAGAFGGQPERVGGRWYFDVAVLTDLAVRGPTPAVGELLARVHRNAVHILEASRELATRQATGLTVDRLAGHVEWLQEHRAELLAQLEADVAEARDRRDTNLTTALGLILAMLPIAAYADKGAGSWSVGFNLPGAIPAPVMPDGSAVTSAPADPINAIEKEPHHADPQV